MIDKVVNGISVGEFADMAIIAGELGIPSIFASGELSFTKEAKDLFPNIFTVATKEGVSPGNGDELAQDEYILKNSVAIHYDHDSVIEEIEKQAEEKNILLVTTGLRGRGPREILTKFKLSDDRHAVSECPEGHKPKASSYIRQSNSIRVSFPRCCCENCPHQKECNAKIKTRTAVVFLSLGVLTHTEQAIKRKDNEIIKLLGRIRNGVETVPSINTM